MKHLVQVVGSDVPVLRKHWHKVVAKDCEGAVIVLLRKNSKAVPRLAQMSGGKLYATVAPLEINGSANIHENGIPIVVHCFNIGLNKNAA